MEGSGTAGNTVCYSESVASCCSNENVQQLVVQGEGGMPKTYASSVWRAYVLRLLCTMQVAALL